ncbi:MAG: aminotransferase class IV [Elusimicrobiota bacterium]
MKQTIVYLNGKYLQEKDAHISIFDRGFLYGDGLYETIRIYDGVPFLLTEHLQRLFQGLHILSMKLPLSQSRIKKIIKNLIQKNKSKEAVARIFISRGVSNYGIGVSGSLRPTILITTYPFVPLNVDYERGVVVTVSPFSRNGARATPPFVKSTNCLNGILARIHAEKEHSFEAIHLTDKGFVAEGTVSNIFWIKNGILFTPPLDGDILPGITRQFILKKAQSLKMKVQEKKIKLPELCKADRIFLTSSLIEMLPVRALKLKNNFIWKTKNDYLEK